MFEHYITFVLMQVRMKKVIQGILLGILLIIIISAGVLRYLYTKTFENTATIKSTETCSAAFLINEFKNDLPAANAKYAEKIISVDGQISELEKGDTSLNIKFKDSTGAYLIFSLKADEKNRSGKLNEGDSITIKGSCSGGSFSSILGIVYIPFKRCVIEKTYK